ncbi:GSCOCG00009244001-RA-CDS [Cotesia congregata]|nr:GSCOCG00009244001-RA-CDS [Cotesia congregata]
MATVDFKDAYYLISIKESSRKYLIFLFGHKLYKFTCMSFGLNTAPYVFTKIMRVVESVLRKKRFLSIGKSNEDFLKNLSKICELLKKLGFITNKNKSSLMPKTNKKFSGFVLDSERMLFKIEIYSDASLSGWGASSKEKKNQINYLELLAAFLASKSFVKECHNCNIYCLGSTIPPPYHTLIVWEWCEQRKL